MTNEYNFFRSTRESDKELFFGPLGCETFISIEENDILAHLLYKAEIFKSVSEARKNGYNKEIPCGFSDFKIGKRKTRITIFKEKTL
jgi:hypothetical protein